MIGHQVIQRTEQLMLRALVGYREDLDLENAIDFIQKKVTALLDTALLYTALYLHLYEDQLY